MARRIFTTAERCPADDAPVAMRTCGGCRFFRGAASSRHEPRGWEVCCNWPRSGLFLAAPVERPSTAPVPDAFRSAFEVDP
jgi:hypothetical protein